MNISYAISVPLIAVILGFVSPEIDLNHNVRESQRTGTEKLETPRTRKGFQDFKGRIRERYNHRRVAQYYVNSWFIVSFSLDINDNTLLRVKDIYAKTISNVGFAIKGDKFTTREQVRALRKIYMTFDRELKKTLDAKQYKKLKDMTEPKKVDKGEI